MTTPATTTAPVIAAPVSTSAKPEAVQRATPDAKGVDGVLSTMEARNFLKSKRAERQKLKLVPEAEDLSADIEETATDIAAVVDGEAPEAEGDKPPEVEPTWAQKLRGDLTKKTERVAELEKQHQAREAKFAEASRAVAHQIEDVQADIKAEQGYSAMLEQAIADAGFTVPADWKRAALAERKAERLERHLARGQKAVAAQGYEKSAEGAKAQLAELGKTIPEIAAGFAGKDPEVRAWLQKRFALSEDGKPLGLGMKNIADDALAFAKALRWDRHSKAQASKTTAQPKPGEAQRPSSTTLNGSAANAGAKRAPSVPKSEKESAAWLAARRAGRK